MIDSQNMGKVLDEVSLQLEEAYKLGKDIEVNGPFDSFVFCGMGGSGVTGDLMRAYLQIEKPIISVKDYDLPKYVTKNSLVFCISYSGNTEETISCYRQARKIGCQIIVVASGGKLIELANLNDIAKIELPKGQPPRLSLGYMFIPILNVLMENGQIPDANKDIHATIKALKQDIFKKPAQDLAKKLVNKIPIVYASTRMGVISTRWKTDINENAKIHAWTHVFPEFNHHEILGYENLNGDYYCIMIKDEDDHPQIKKRMKICKDLIKKEGVSVTEMVITGENRMTKIFSALYIGHYLAYYLALEYERDPTPVKIIEELKQELKS